MWLGERYHLHNNRAPIGERRDRRHRRADAVEVGLEPGIFSVTHCVVAAAGAIELVGNHKRQWGLLTAVDLPAVVEDVHTRIRGRGHHQFWRRQGTHSLVRFEAGGVAVDHFDCRPTLAVGRYDRA